eukprot:12379966-Ditylum_brightwellii.AAC.1
MAEFSEIILKDYGVKKRPIAVRNHQANSIIERITQTIGNMIKSFEVHITDINEKDPWTGILSSEICNKSDSTHNHAGHS